jgi:decaprenylphospho-beta-D-ribofuranose 2-oxidase
MRRFNRILAWDGDKGVLDAEAGVTLHELFEFLLPRGFWMPVNPGYPKITLGGCIAGNVHGKNQYRDGTFSRHVLGLSLFHPDRGVLALSRDENPELLDLTVGGYGLTGFILSARIQVVRLQGNAAVIRHVPVSDLSETFARLSDLAATNELVYSWNDLSNFGRRFGRGYVVAGSIVQTDRPPERARAWHELDPYRRRRRLPLANNLTLPWMNGLYYRATIRQTERQRSLFDFVFPIWTKSFYFDLFGQAGIIEPQIIVPHDALAAYVVEFTHLLQRHRQPFALGSFKLFGGRRQLLRYDGEGISFSCELPRCRGSLALLADMDRLNNVHGAYTNLIKDSRISAETARAQYPEYDAFKTALHRFDPGRLFVSELSERLNL